MSLKTHPERFVVVAGVLAALLALSFYLYFGRPALWQGKRELENSSLDVRSVQVEDQPQGSSTVTVYCEDGSSYEIYFPAGETNYEAVRAAKCATAN